MKTGLVLEGGALRTIFSSGVCDAFLDAGLMPDYIVGVSAGIAYGVSYVSKQSRRNLQIVMHYARDRRYMGIRNLLDRKNQAYFGLQFAYEEIPQSLIPFDYQTFANYEGQVEAVLTNLETGQADYLEVPRETELSSEILEATCAMPLLFPIFHINGQPYLDGGCADGIPWRRALEQGCDRVVVVLTRPRDYIRSVERVDKVIHRRYRKYPAFVELMHRRGALYNQSRRELFALEREGRILVLAPEDTHGVARTERNLKKLLTLWQDGYLCGYHQSGRVAAFWGRQAIEPPRPRGDTPVQQGDCPPDTVS